jgi:hypothetical protein
MMRMFVLGTPPTGSSPIYTMSPIIWPTTSMPPTACRRLDRPCEVEQARHIALVMQCRHCLRYTLATASNMVVVSRFGASRSCSVWVTGADSALSLTAANAK